MKTRCAEDSSGSFISEPLQTNPLQTGSKKTNQTRQGRPPLNHHNDSLSEERGATQYSGALHGKFDKSERLAPPPSKGL